MALVDIYAGKMLLEILAEETRRMADRQKKGGLTGADVQALERLAKTYHVLKTEDREAEKGFNKLTEAELLELAGQTEEGTDSAD